MHSVPNVRNFISLFFFVYSMTLQDIFRCAFPFGLGYTATSCCITLAPTAAGYVILEGNCLNHYLVCHRGLYLWHSIKALLHTILGGCLSVEIPFATVEGAANTSPCGGNSKSANRKG
jgi:hypothetical protein